MTTQLTQQQQINYYPILAIVQQVDGDLTRNRCHYRNNAGRLLLTLDEVVRAILNNDLLIKNSTQAAVISDFSRKEQ